VQFFKFLTLNFQIYEIIPSKNANLDNFIPKKCDFGQLSPSESEKYGVIITFFETFPNGGGEASHSLG